MVCDASQWFMPMASSQNSARYCFARPDVIVATIGSCCCVAPEFAIFQYAVKGNLMNTAWRFALALSLAVFASFAEAGSYVYVSVAGDRKISIFEMAPETGALRSRGAIVTAGEPGCLTMGPSRRFLFASIRSTGDLASFRIDPATGALAPISTIVADADPAYVATDRTGRFLLSAYYRAGKVAVHPIGADGSLDAKQGRWLVTDKNAHAILTDRSNRYAFVPHTGPNRIFQFRFDVKTGTLTPNRVPMLKTGDWTGPRHIAFHRTKPFAYVDNEQGSGVTMLAINPSSGTLRPVMTLSTLPGDFTGSNSCARLEIDPSGRFLYAANRGHDSIAGFAVDANDGRLTSIGQTSTERTPRSFTIGPNGRFLYAAGESSGKLASYRIEPSTGRLARLATHDLGSRPWWVLAAKIR